MKFSIRKIAELGIGAIAIATLVLAGCGGGGGGGISLSTVLSVVASLGQLKQGTAILVTDSKGATANGVVDSTGHASVTVTGFTPPMLVSVLPDSSNNIYFYDEKALAIIAASAPSAGAIRALVPVVTAGITNPVGVTPFTEMAAGFLAQNGAIKSDGTLAASATPALATAAASAVGAFVGMTATDMLLPPAIIGATTPPLSDLTSASNRYALKLAALANMATGTNNALKVSQTLTSSFQTGTFGSGLATNGVIGGVTATAGVVPTSNWSTAFTAAMASAASNASQVPATVATSDLGTAQNTVTLTMPSTGVVTQLITDSVGGFVSANGLTGTLVLQNNSGDNLTITAGGNFTFATQIANGSTYNVTVLTQPSNQTCTVSNGSGTISGNNVLGVYVTCNINTYSLSGTVSGLTGTGSVVLQDSSEQLTVAANGSFNFVNKIASGSPYSVSVSTQPVGQTCSVANGTNSTGIVANVNNIAITCAANRYTIGGGVSGLQSGNLVLQDNGGDNTTITASGNFTFPTTVAYNGSYNVTVLTQPTGQTCSLSGSSGSGTVTANVTSVAVVCSTNTAIQIAGAKTLLQSLRTETQLLANPGKTGLLDMQASGVQADLTSSQGVFSEANDFQKFVTNAIGLLRNGNVGSPSSPYVTQVYANGMPWPCGAVTTAVTGTGAAVCQWVKQNNYGDQATHQVIVTGPIGSAPPQGTSYTPSLGTYTWAEAIVADTDSLTNLPTPAQLTASWGSNQMSSYGTEWFGTSLPQVIQSPAVTNRPLIPISTNLNPTTTTPANGPAAGTVTLAVGSTGTLVFDSSGNIIAGSSANLTFNGYSLPSALSPHVVTNSIDPVTGATNIKIDHLYQNMIANLSATGSPVVATVTFGAGSTLSRVGATLNCTSACAPFTFDSIALGSGSSVSFYVGNGGNTQAINLTGLTATTPNYRFVGSLVMSGFIAEKNTNPFSTPNVIPSSSTFTGSVTGINGESSYGTFMTGTLGATVSGQGSYDPTLNTTASNYLHVSGTFDGSITNNTFTPAQTYSVHLTADRSTTWNTAAIHVVYTDPVSNTVTLNESIVNNHNGTGDVSSGTASMGGITIVLDTNNNGSVYYGYSSPASPGTLIGIIGTVAGQPTCGNGLVCFTDGTTQSVQ